MGKVIINIAYKDIVPRYIENRIDDIKKLKELLSEKNFKAISSLVHSIKGSGGMYGFDTISFIAKNIEDESRDQNKEEILQYIEVFEKYIKELEIQYK
ncbi:MAG: Hpt domain-containing protein [Clostridiales bacterium]